MHPDDADALRETACIIASRLERLADGDDSIAPIAAAELRCALDIVAWRMTAPDRRELRNELLLTLDALAES